MCLISDQFRSVDSGLIGTLAWRPRLQSRPELLGTELVANLEFEAVTERSSFVSVSLSNDAASRSRKPVLPDLALPSGRMTVLSTAPLVDIGSVSQGIVGLYLYGDSVARYSVESCADAWRGKVLNL